MATAVEGPAPTLAEPTTHTYTGHRNYGEAFTGQQVTVPTEGAEEETTTKKKKATRPTFKLDHLFREEGLGYLNDKSLFPGFKPRHGGRSAKRDLGTLLHRYKIWQKGVFGSLSFPEFARRLERFSSNYRVKLMLGKIRDGLDPLADRPVDPAAVEAELANVGALPSATGIEGTGMDVEEHDLDDIFGPSTAAPSRDGPTSLDAGFADEEEAMMMAELETGEDDTANTLALPPPPAPAPAPVELDDALRERIRKKREEALAKRAAKMAAAAEARAAAAAVDDDDNAENVAPPATPVASDAVSRKNTAVSVANTDISELSRLSPGRMQLDSPLAPNSAQAPLRVPGTEWVPRLRRVSTEDGDDSSIQPRVLDMNEVDEHAVSATQPLPADSDPHAVAPTQAMSGDSASLTADPHAVAPTQVMSGEGVSLESDPHAVEPTQMMSADSEALTLDPHAVAPTQVMSAESASLSMTEGEATSPSRKRSLDEEGDDEPEAKRSRGDDEAKE